MDQKAKASKQIFFFFSASIYHTTFMQCQIICQNNLLQSTKMPTIKGKKCADLVIDTLESMRNDEDFDSFFEVVQKAADPIKPVEKPTLPRQQKKRSLSPRNSSRLFKHLYFRALDAVISAINDRSEQPALKKFRNVEERLLKAINKANSSKKWKVLEANLLEDFDRIQLESELDIIPAIFKRSAPVNFREICKTFQDIDEEKRRMIKDIWTFYESC